MRIDVTIAVLVLLGLYAARKLDQHEYWQQRDLERLLLRHQAHEEMARINFLYPA